MRAHPHEQFDPSQAWRIAEGFLAKHAVSPDGLPLSPGVVQVMMVGVWTGCRLALLDRKLALGVAEEGNGRPGIVYEALRLAFAAEFDAPLQQMLCDALRERGFTNAGSVRSPLCEPGPGPLSAADAIDAAEELLRDAPEPDGEEPQ